MPRVSELTITAVALCLVLSERMSSTGALSLTGTGVPIAGSFCTLSLRRGNAAFVVNVIRDKNDHCGGRAPLHYKSITELTVRMAMRTVLSNMIDYVGRSFY